MGRTIALGMLLALGGAGTAYADAAAGKTLYDTKCKVCHSIGTEKGKMADKGGPLDGVGSKRDAAWLKKYLQDPKASIPDAKMPKMKLTDQELEDLIAYMLTLQ